MSRSADDEQSQVDPGWAEAREELFHMIMEGRSFSGRERNCCFLNTGEERFATISSVSGLDFPDDARCIAVTDWDQDGDQDLWIGNRNGPRLRFMRNETPRTNHFVTLRLDGDGETTNRDAIGARVVVEVAPADGATAGTRISKTLRAGEGFLSQSSKWLHFGLGTADSISQITVHWPGGEPQTFSDLRVDKRYRLTQHRSQVEVVEVTERSAIDASEPVIPDETRVARVKIEVPVPMPAVEYTSSNGTLVTNSFDSGKPTLVNLWATWCGPCLEELGEFASHHQQLADAGVSVVALSVDEFKTQSTSMVDVERMVEKLSYPFPWGHLDASQLDSIQGLHNLLFFLRRPLPLPSSLLIDAEGRLSVIYRGPVSVAQVLADVDASRITRPLHHIVASLPGRTIDHPRVHAITKETELQTRYRVASWLQAIDRVPDAIEHFTAMAAADRSSALPRRRLAKLHLEKNQLQLASKYASAAVELDPGDAKTHVVIGLIAAREGNHSVAEQHFREAIKQDSQLAGAHNNLGIVLAMQGKFKIAGDSFRQAVKLDDQFAEGHTNLGNVYASQGNFKQAAHHYQRAIKIDPKYVEAYNNLGTLFGRQGQLDKAIQCYQHSLKIAPNHPGTRQYLQKALNAARQR